MHSSATWIHYGLIVGICSLPSCSGTASARLLLLLSATTEFVANVALMEKQHNTSKQMQLRGLAATARCRLPFAKLRRTAHAVVFARTTLATTTTLLHTCRHGDAPAHHHGAWSLPDPHEPPRAARHLQAVARYIHACIRASWCHCSDAQLILATTTV